jgi:hypothetical protein
MHEVCPLGLRWEWLVVVAVFLGGRTLVATAFGGISLSGRFDSVREKEEARGLPCRC